MNIVEFGSGPPVVVIPGIQGRWEWMRPGIEALATRCRVITFSLCDEPCSGSRFDKRRGLDSYVDQVRDALDRCGLGAATICGISYGGLIAAAFAARYPARTTSLVLVSALPPSWSPDRRARMYLKAPRLLVVPFWLSTLFQMHPELKAAIPDRWVRLRTALACGWQIVRHPSSPVRMCRRVRLAEGLEPPSLSSVRMPTLIITGDAVLDRIVPVRATLRYAALIPHARVAILERTGHRGIVTRPHAFAGLVAPFAAEHFTAEAAEHSIAEEVRKHA